MENIFKNKITLSDKIKKIRIEKGMNQKDFSTLLGVKQSYYSELENGKREVTTKILSELKSKLNISIDWFLSNSTDESLDSSVTKSIITESELQLSENKSEIVINAQETTQEQLIKAFTWMIFNNYKSKYDTSIKYDSFNKLSKQFMATQLLCEQIQQTLELDITHNILEVMTNSIKEGKDDTVIPEEIKQVIDKYDVIYNDFLNESDAMMKIIEITDKHQKTLSELLKEIDSSENT